MVLGLMHTGVFRYLIDGSGFGKNLIIFGVDMRSSVHIDNKTKIS